YPTINDSKQGVTAVFRFIDKLLSSINKQLSQRGLSLYIPEGVYAILMKNGYSERYGVREMDRVLQKMIVEPLAEEILKDRFKPGDTIHLKIGSERIVFQEEDKLKTS
ncbi:MAG: hypothetical protein AABZ05_02435, partial [Nitrospirota bacterium]